MRTRRLTTGGVSTGPNLTFGPGPTGGRRRRRATGGSAAGGLTAIRKLGSMDNWSIAASLATAAGTLVLAAATFVAVRSSNRAARATERALLAGIRPVLVSSRMEDPPEKVGFQDDHWIRVPGGRAVAEVTEDAV